MGKISKFITMTALAAATGAGVYYYLNKSQLESAKNDENSEGVSGTGTTAQDSVTDFFRDKREAIMNSREYVSLSKNVSTAKDALNKTVSEAAEVIRDKAQEAKEGIGVVSEEVKDKAEDFEFEDFAGADEAEAKEEASLKSEAASEE